MRKHKKGLYLTSQPVRAGQLFNQITQIVKELLPNGEIKVTCPDMQKLEAERDDALKMLEEMAGALDAMIKSCDKHNCGLKIADAILDKYKRWKAGE